VLEKPVLPLSVSVPPPVFAWPSLVSLVLGTWPQLAAPPSVKTRPATTIALLSCKSQYLI
jgi:hypothetical protein